MTLNVQVVSPERVLFGGDAQIVFARTIGGGDIAFLTDHAPFLGALETWPVVMKLESGESVRVAVHGGFVEVANNRVFILSDVAELADAIDVERARDSLARAEAALHTDPDDEDAASAAARARVRLEVTDATTSA